MPLLLQAVPQIDLPLHVSGANSWLGSTFYRHLGVNYSVPSTYGSNDQIHTPIVPGTVENNQTVLKNCFPSHVSSNTQYTLLIENEQLYYIGWGWRRNQGINILGNASAINGTIWPLNDTFYNNNSFGTGWSHCAGNRRAAVGIRNGNLFVWGEEAFWNLASHTPISLSGNSNWQKVETNKFLTQNQFFGSYFYIGIRNGYLYGWGVNYSSNKNFTVNPNNIIPYYTLTDSVPITQPYQWTTRGLVPYNYDLTKYPIQLDDTQGWTDISCGRWHTVGIRNGKLFKWGLEESGELSFGSSLFPTITQIGTLDDWTHVAVGSNFTLAIRQGKLYGWEYSNPPQQIGTHSDWTAISSGENHLLAVRDGHVYSWGSNLYGQLGLGDYQDRTSPTLVPTLSGVFNVSAGLATSFFY